MVRQQRNLGADLNGNINM